MCKLIKKINKLRICSYPSLVRCSSASLASLQRRAWNRRQISDSTLPMCPHQPPHSCTQTPFLQIHGNKPSTHGSPHLTRHRNDQIQQHRGSEVIQEAQSWRGRASLWHVRDRKSHAEVETESAHAFSHTAITQLRHSKQRASGRIHLRRRSSLSQRKPRASIM